ncbi:MAG: FkbM family methyltransferase [Tepidisphaerales bacterium]
MYTALEVFTEGEYVDVLEHVKNALIVVDLGSNVGYSTMVWRAAWPACTIVAVEPDEENLHLARTNLESTTREVGRGTNVYRNAAVSSKAGRLLLDRSGGAWMYRLVSSGGGSGGGRAAPRGAQPDQLEPVEVEVITVDHLLSTLPEGTAIDLLKCDIEGAEVELFGDTAALRRWLPRVRHLVVETHQPYTLPALEADLDRTGVPWVCLSRSEKGSASLGLYKVMPASPDGTSATLP